ncbi:MAG TPA: chemotaxis-specific protein-glutamate methyltransferase CheB [Jatrophihabitans sp.]|nr:chemotaxis-specific protein-glutamate methyltransferase CheB [Jatrophihabitans sp.]
MPIRVLVVDDSVVVRRLVSDVLAADPDIAVVGTAANGRIALAKLELLEVDVITLDLEMPELDGIGTLKHLRAAGSKLPVIVFSTLTEQGAAATLDALAAGATDYVTKPSNMGSVVESRESVRSQLVPRIKSLTRVPVGGSATTPRATPVVHARPRTEPPKKPRVVVIGCSTGGPEALVKVLAGLPASFPLPILVVQHMPPVFTRLFAERLDRASALRVTETAGREPVVPGTVLVAPGDSHLEVAPDPRRSGGVLTLLQKDPPENFCRPAVDVLFRSATTTYNGALLAVVLTGMGSDGAAGAAVVREHGGQVVVQDAATSVVWGMPGVIAERGLADAVLPLRDVAASILQRVGGAQSRPSVAARRGSG